MNEDKKETPQSEENKEVSAQPTEPIETETLAQLRAPGTRCGSSAKTATASASARSGFA